MTGEDKQAEGFIREVLGQLIEDYGGAAKSEKYGKTYAVKVRQVPYEELQMLKKRFEVLEILPTAGEPYFTLNMRRVE